MKNEELISSVNRKLKINFYGWFAMLVLLFGMSYILDFSFPKVDDSLTIGLQQLLILSMLGGIPGILVWSKKKMKALANISDIGDRLRLYKKYVRIRQSVFFVLGILALLAHLFTMQGGALRLFGIVVCLCIFIVPTRKRMETEADLMEPETEAGSDQEMESEVEF